MKLKERVRRCVAKVVGVEQVNEATYQGEAVDTIWYIVGAIIVVALAYFLWPQIQSYGSQFLTLLWSKITGLLS